MLTHLTIGIDLGTSGVRAVALKASGEIAAKSSRPIPDELRRDPEHLFRTTTKVLADLAANLRAPIQALAICGTSGSFVPLDKSGGPVGRISLYSDKAPPTAVMVLKEHAPASAPVHGPNSPLAKIMSTDCFQIAFETDFIASRLMGTNVPTDINNALKAGADPVAIIWPKWIELCGTSRSKLPTLVEPGTPLGNLSQTARTEIGFQNTPIICAGTTDGCAAVLAAGLKQSGDAVTSLGSTLTLKVLSDFLVVSVPHGIYSHRLLGKWLVGGASNSGGAAVRAHFSDAKIRDLAPQINPRRKLDLNYVPLITSGERFPVFDPYLMPRFSPRPNLDAEFLHAILESLVRVERHGYSALQAQGASKPKRIATVGNGIKNSAWMGIRKRDLPAALVNAEYDDPACGAAILAAAGLRFNSSPFSENI